MKSKRAGAEPATIRAAIGDEPWSPWLAKKARRLNKHDFDDVRSEEHARNSIARASVLFQREALPGFDRFKNAADINNPTKPETAPDADRFGAASPIGSSRYRRKNSTRRSAKPGRSSLVHSLKRASHERCVADRHSIVWFLFRPIATRSRFGIDVFITTVVHPRQAGYGIMVHVRIGEKHLVFIGPPPVAALGLGVSVLSCVTVILLLRSLDRMKAARIECLAGRGEDVAIAEPVPIPRGSERAYPEWSPPFWLKIVGILLLLMIFSRAGLIAVTR